MSGILSFGEQVDGYPVRVLNERAARAAAGIVFFFAIVSFMNAWLIGNFHPTRVFVGAFLIDFTIRIFVNPRHAPSLILGQWFVRKQQPDYVGAPQKRFAWAIGFALALTMLYLVVINDLIGPINLIVCAACLILLFFEAAFGICIGCKVYEFFHPGRAQVCPGGACEISPAPGSGVDLFQGTVLVVFAGLVGATAFRTADHAVPGASPQANATNPLPAPVNAADAERCKVPDFAKAIGHEAKWKLHNHCK